MQQTETERNKWKAKATRWEFLFLQHFCPDNPALRINLSIPEMRTGWICSDSCCQRLWIMSIWNELINELHPASIWIQNKYLPKIFYKDCPFKDDALLTFSSHSGPSESLFCVGVFFVVLWFFFPIIILEIFYWNLNIRIPVWETESWQGRKTWWRAASSPLDLLLKSN